MYKPIWYYLSLKVFHLFLNLPNLTVFLAKPLDLRMGFQGGDSPD